MLRIGEANKAPLPPPPPPGGIQPPDTPTLEEAPELEDEPDAIHEDSVNSTSDKPHKKTASKLVGLIKGTTKATVRSALGVDRVKATVGSEPSKLRVGVIGKKGERETDGPTSFDGRHHGKKGTIIVSASATSPCISFVKNFEGRGDMKPIFTTAVDDIAELRKIGGFGWKGKLLVGWALGTEVADGLEIVDKLGNVECLSAVPRRDEVFNRLIALSNKQHWESR